MIPIQNIKIVSIFLYFILSSVTLAVVQANDSTLIAHLCDGTSAPKACTDCINSRPGPVNTNKDAVLTLLYCAYLDSQGLQNDTDTAIKDQSIDQTTRDALNKSYPIIQIVVRNSESLREFIGAEKYKVAKDDIDGYVNDKIKEISGLLGAPGVKTPPKVFSGLFSTSSDYGITSQVLGVV